MPPTARQHRNFTENFGIRDNLPAPRRSEMLIDLALLSGNVGRDIIIG